LNVGHKSLQKPAIKAIPIKFFSYNKGFM